MVQLSHFVDSEHLEEGLSLLQQVKHPGYYAKMAAAWALSEWYVKFPQAVGQLLAQQTLEPWVQNKAIQKGAGIPPGEQGGKGRAAPL